MRPWVNMAVPEHMVLGFMSQIMEEMVGDGGEVLTRTERVQSESSVPEGAVKTYHRGWTEEGLRRLLANPTRSVRIIMTLVALADGEPVSSITLSKEVYGEEASGNQLGGALGSLTRRIRRDFDTLDPVTWPFTADPPTEERNYWEYWTDKETASLIRRILGLE